MVSYILVTMVRYILVTMVTHSGCHGNPEIVHTPINLQAEAINFQPSAIHIEYSYNHI